MTIKQQVLEVFQGRALTADEAADQIGCSILAVRPRVTELYNEGLLSYTGYVGENFSGKRARVLIGVPA